MFGQDSKLWVTWDLTHFLVLSGLNSPDLTLSLVDYSGGKPLTMAEHPEVPKHETGTIKHISRQRGNLVDVERGANI